MAIVEATNITKVYGKRGNSQTRALDGISFRIESGEFLGIMGPSGSGKSTLLNVLSTLDRSTTGTVRIVGRDITKLKGNELADFRGKKIGFIFQDFSLLENMSAKDNIAIPLSLQKVVPSEIDQQVKRVASRLGIAGILNKFPTQLSGGQKQRVAAARALIAQPSIVFADEPTGALDSVSAKSLLLMLSQINQRDKVTILMVTHDPLSASYCSRVIFVKDGQIATELKWDNTELSDFRQQIVLTANDVENREGNK